MHACMYPPPPPHPQAPTPTGTHPHTHMHATAHAPHAHMHVHARARTHTCARTHARTHTCACTHARTHMHEHTHAHMSPHHNTGMHTCMHKHTHTHTCTHTHTHRHAHTQARTHARARACMYAQTRLLLGEYIVDNTHLCSNQWSCLFHSDTTLHKGIDEMYFIVQTFMLWYQYYGNRETNITQCSQKLCDCKSTRIITYSNISNIFLLLIHFDF